MINDSETDVNAVIVNCNVKLQTEVAETTKKYLRIEAIRRRLTMGQLLDEIVAMICSDVSKSTS
ncbi:MULTISPECIES: hypothetical protein [unclassified Microcoleus]|uniref:hypothetical protein n=1 Tax=unclassified Microcoleus TaxID=2642155 RepID=UPI002FD28F2D